MTKKMKLATLVILSIFAIASPLHAEDQPSVITRESQTPADLDEDKKAQEAALKAEFEGYIEDYPFLKEIKDDLKVSAATYAVHMKKTREMALDPAHLKMKKGEYIVRLIILDPAGKNSTIIRINKTYGGTVLIVKKFNATKVYQGEKKGVYDLSDPINISGHDFETLEQLITKCDFYNMRTGVPEVAVDTPTMLVEAVSPTEHKIVERYLTGASNDAFFAMCHKVGLMTKMDLGALTKE